jgi:hypothetical protein
MLLERLDWWALLGPPHLTTTSSCYSFNVPDGSDFVPFFGEDEKIVKHIYG